MNFLGIDLGGTNIAAGVVDKNGSLIAKGSVPTRKAPWQEVISDMAKLANDVTQNAGLSMQGIQSIGIGSPGIPDNEKGTIVRNYNLGFHNTPVRTEMQKYFSVPIQLENDANCAALAESAIGAAKGVKHSVTITLGTGIGGGIVIDGKIYSGFNHAASELGHMVIVRGGEKCSCGKLGCWEAYAAASALIRQTVNAAKQNPHSVIHSLVQNNLDAVNAKTVFDAYEQGDGVAAEVIDAYISYLSEGIINIIDILHPEVIVLGGGVSQAGDAILVPLRKAVCDGAFSTDVLQTEIRLALLGNDAGIIGAAMLGRN